jgi:hypothetical protein
VPNCAADWRQAAEITFRGYEGEINMRGVLFAGVASGAIALSGSAFASCGTSPISSPSVGLNPCGPEYLIVYATNGAVSTELNPAYSSNPGPYDGSDDTYIGVVNDSSKPISSIFLKSSSGLDIGGFEGDGIDVSPNPTSGLPGLGIPNNPKDSTGYGGPDAFFTNNMGISLTVNFITPIAASGGTDIFSLEEKVDVSTVIPTVPEPSTWGMMLLGFAGLGYAGYRRAREPSGA